MEKLKPTKCTCGSWPDPDWTSMDFGRKWQAMQTCPKHSVVPDKDTWKYEPEVAALTLRRQKGFVHLGTSLHGVFQAVGLKQVGIKAFDQRSLIRAISIFPTRNDARRYLLKVLETVKSEQRRGLRSKRNLDPKFDGGLDFCILPVIISTPKAPLEKRGWQIEKKTTKRKKTT